MARMCWPSLTGAQTSLLWFDIENGFLSPFGDMTLWNILASCIVIPYISSGLDHGVGHFRPLSITRQRHLLAYHGIAMSCESLCGGVSELLIPCQMARPNS